MLICGHSMQFTPFFKHKICVLYSETLHSFNIRSTVINSYEFTADLHYIISIYGMHFACHFHCHHT